MSKLVRMSVYTTQKSTGFLCIPDDVDTTNEQALHAACVEAMESGAVQLLDDNVYIEDAEDAIDYEHIISGQYRIIKDITVKSIGEPLTTHDFIECASWKRDNRSTPSDCHRRRHIQAAESVNFTYCAVNLMVDDEQVGAGVWRDGWAPTTLARLKATATPLPDAELLFFGDYSPIQYASYRLNPMQHVCECTNDCFAIRLATPCTKDEPYELLTYWVNGVIHGMEVVRKSYMDELRVRIPY